MRRLTSPLAVVFVHSGVQAGGGVSPIALADRMRYVSPGWLSSRKLRIAWPTPRSTSSAGHLLQARTLLGGGPENFPQQGTGSGGWVFANAFLLLSHHGEQAVQGLARDIGIHVHIHGAQQ